MNEIECHGKKIAIDDDGFLVHTEDWDEDVAQTLARLEGFDSVDNEQM